MTQLNPKRSLGRGLSALLGENSMTDSHMELSPDSLVVSIHKIRPGKYQPRMNFDDEKLEMLIESVREKGIIQPLIIRPIEDGTTFEIIAGERRWRAAKTLGFDEVPAIIRPCSDQEALETAIVENIQRDDLTAIEEAEAYQRLIDEFSYTQEQLGRAVGKSRSHIANTLRLVSLPANIKDMIQSGKITAGHARTLITADNPTELANKIVNEGLNVRQAEQMAKSGNSLIPEPSELANQLNLLQEQIGSLLNQKVSLKVNRSGAALSIYFNSYEEIDAFLDNLRQSVRFHESYSE